MKKNVVLTGFMGAGKTSTGKMLAMRLGCGFVDLDQNIEESAGMSIPDIFARYGEKHFRGLEKKAVEDVCKRRNVVIATGGGTMKDADNFRALSKHGVVVALTADIDVILERTARHGERPVLDEEDTGDRRAAIEKLLAERREIYERASHTVDTSELSPLQVTEEITRFLKREGLICGRNQCAAKSEY